MTGIAGLVDFVQDPLSWRGWRRLRRVLMVLFHRTRDRDAPQRFLVLCWRRTGSNWLCGMLHNHPEVLMHNELFNESAIHTYHQEMLGKWTYESRDIVPTKFLRFIYHDFRDTSSKVRAIGFKSFPDHWWDNGRPNVMLERVHTGLLNNPGIKKVILKRRNLLAVYLSMVLSSRHSAYLMYDYSDAKVEISLTELQRFMDRYHSAYDRYERLAETGQDVHVLEYEALCAGPDALAEEMKRLFVFLGVDESIAPQALRETVVQNTNKDIRTQVSNYAEVEFAFRHTQLAPSLGKMEEPQAHNSTSRKFSAASAVCSSSPSPSPVLTTVALAGCPNPLQYQWALLLPLSSRGSDQAQCRVMLSNFAASIVATTEASERNLLEVVVGIDVGDPVYDSDAGHALISSSLDPACTSRVVAFKGLEQKICHIWHELAQSAVDHGADFFVLLGDDVRLKSKGWKSAIEMRFHEISAKRGLPFGAACVAFLDTSFINFPTFPVLHRWHMKSFCRLVPKRLLNQGADPFVFELYKRVGASEFEHGAVLENTIGGIEEARYVKRAIRWNNDQLTQYIEKLHVELPGAKRFLCVDVVVPTFRVNVALLRQVVALRASVEAVAITFWIIVDNPDAPQAALDQVRLLESLGNNYTVNVRVHPRNMGVSAARNTGIAYSNADWCILLDDDVVPDHTLLDAYLGACMRHPGADIYAGKTVFPPASTTVTRALRTCSVIGFYSVCDTFMHPPWSPTSNLMCRARTNRVRFKINYPYSGGGEDIAFCVQSDRGPGSIVAVPGAIVTHPWWADGSFKAFAHVFGWALGESLATCDPDLSQHAFRTLPNTTEWALFSLMLAVVLSMVFGVVALSQQLLTVSFLVTFLQMAARTSKYHRRAINLHLQDNASLTSQKDFAAIECCSLEFGLVPTALAAAVLVTGQEAARVLAMVRHGSLGHIAVRFDWYCGKRTSFVSAQRFKTVLDTMIYAVTMLFVRWVLESDPAHGMDSGMACSPAGHGHQSSVSELEGS